jgi:BolA protein
LTVQRQAWLEERLRRALEPEFLEIEDESSRHAGHAGAAAGGGHFRVTIVSASFRGKDLIARQRAVYSAVAEGMPSIVHALALSTLTPEEWSEKGSGGKRQALKRP